MSIIEQCISRKVLPKIRKIPWMNAGIRHPIRKHNYLYRNQNAIQIAKLSIRACTKFTRSGAHDVIAITSPQKNDLCTKELCGID